MVSRVKALLENLIDAFQAGDWERAGKCFAEQGMVLQRWGPNPGAPGKPWLEARHALEQLVKHTGLPKYSDRKTLCTEDGFVEQHVTELTPPGAKTPSKLYAALVGQIDHASGLILSLEEYLDPAPIGMPLAKKRSGAQRKLVAPGIQKPTAQSLEGKVVVVSGSSSGIGEGISLECARRKARLVLTARRQDQLERVAAACRDAGASDVIIIAGDIRAEDIGERIAEAAARFGGVDRLYVNAGISQNTHFMNAPVSAVREQMEVNFFGGVLLTRACLPSLLERKGRLVAVTSLQGRLPAARNTGYSASKHAMHGFFESLRQEVEHKGVSVTMVMPGPVDTDILSNLKGPGGSTVALVINEAAKKNMVSAAEAGRIAVDACEEGAREVAFPQNMAELLKLRATDPEKVDSRIRKMYETMDTREVSPAAKL